MFVYKDGFIIMNNFNVWNNELNKFIDTVSDKISCDKEKMIEWFSGEGMDFFITGQLAFYKELEQRIPYPVMNPNVLNMQKRCGFDALLEQFLTQFNLFENQKFIAKEFKTFRIACYSLPDYQVVNQMETTIITAHNAYRKSKGGLTMEESKDFINNQLKDYRKAIREEIDGASAALMGLFKPRPHLSLNTTTTNLAGLHL